MRTLLTILVLSISAAALTGCTYEKKYYSSHDEHRHGYYQGERGGYYGGYYGHGHRDRDCR